MPKVRTTVLVHNPDTQLPILLQAGDEVPDWATILNPEVLEGGEPELPPGMATGPDGFDPRREFAGLLAPPEGYTRERLMDVAADMGLRPGEHYPKSAGKDVIFAAIQHHLSGA